MKYQKTNKWIIYVLLFLLFVSAFTPFSYAAPQEFMQLVTFSESTSRNQSSVVNIKDLGELKSVTTNNGTVTYSVNGENVTINVSNGTSHRNTEHTPSTNASTTESSLTNSFPGSISYSSRGYSGTLYKNGSPYTYTASPSQSRYETASYTNNTVWAKFKWDGSSWYIYENDVEVWAPNHIDYSSGGFTGRLNKTGGVQNSSVWSAVSGVKGSKPNELFNGGNKVYESWTAFYGGTVTKPAVTGYKQDYFGTVYGAKEYTYYYKYDVAITYTKKVNIPTPPTFSDITRNQIRVDWTSNGNEVGTTYQLYCNNTGSIIYNGTGTSFLHTGLNTNTLYTYKVKAINTNNVESAYSAERTASTLAFDPLPDGFDNLTHNSVRIKWLHNGNPADTEYRYIVKNAGTTTVVSSGWVTGTNGTATGLTPNTEYDMYVKVRNKSGVESPNEIYVGRTYTLSAVPSNLSISNPQQKSLTISWTNNLNPAGTKYQLFNINSGSIVYEGTNLSFVHAGLMEDTNYGYQVRSVNHNNVNSSYTAVVSKITLPYTITSLGINNITSSSMTGNISSANTSPGTRYYFEIKDSGGVPIANSGWITQTSRTFTGLLPNKVYRITAIVRNDSGSLPEILVDQKATLPNVPGVPVLQAGSTRLSNPLMWSTNSNPAGTVYELHIKPLDGVYSLAYTGTSNTFTHTYSIWNSFYYKVRARNVDGEYSAFGPEYFYTDSIKPVGQSVLINSGDVYANALPFNMTANATDDLSGVDKMRFKVNGSSYTSWITYNTSYTYYAPTSFVVEGTNTVYVEFMDLAGNISNAISDTVVYDSIPPEGALIFPQYIITEESITFSVEAADVNPAGANTISGLRNVRFRELNNGVVVKPWSAWEAFRTSKFWTFETSDGLKEVEMDMSDRAGNTKVVKLSVVLDTLFIHKAQFTDIVNPPLGNPLLPTSEMVKIKKGYSFTVMVETMGDPDKVEYSFNGQSGEMFKVSDNLFRLVLKVDKNDVIEKGVLPINLTARRSSDNAVKKATLKVSIMGSAYNDFDVNNTN